MELGRIVGAHALRGEVRVRYFGDGPRHLTDAEGVWLSPTPDASRPDYYAVTAAAPGRKGEVRMALDGVRDRTSAEALRGLLVLGEASSLEPLGEDEYYWHQLVGCEVETGDGRPVGRVAEIWETGAHDLLVVEGPSGRRQLIPTARELMTEVDLAARRIVVEAPPGLLETD